ncbi:hypothetical protein [Spongiactinospora gelatinilytica]|uniref:hypothetical protein n=1 Tax=Spongiactinospora gelatinilytica TaxID=2666298 RepID=UPI0011B93B1A|nr:hypothetical protein [Spongiactinospora gelatinilytica]
MPTEYITPNSTFWQQFLATATGILVLLLVRASCYAFFAEGAPIAGPVCAAVGAFVGTFVAKFILMVIDHKLGDPKAWGEAFAYGVLAAAGALAWESGLNAWAKTQARPLSEDLRCHQGLVEGRGRFPSEHDELHGGQADRTGQEQRMGSGPDPSPDGAGIVLRVR